MSEELAVLASPEADIAGDSLETVLEIEVEVDYGDRASPGARPLSRGSISPMRKPISRGGSAGSQGYAIRATSSQMKREFAEETAEEDDAGYDTDLEIEQEKEEYDSTGKVAYREICEQYNVTPVSYFMRHMQDNELVMRHHGLGANGTKAIAVSLVSNTKILKLDLSDNSLNMEGGIAIADMLIENNYIVDVILSDNQIGYGGAAALSSMLVENTTINRMTLAGNGFDEKAAVPVADIIQTSQRLEQFDLSHNCFNEAASLILGPAIGENTSIKEINLSWNHIRRGGAVAVAKGIGANIFLKSVDLSWNGLGPEGTGALGEALKQNNVLEELNISNNRITTEASILLAKGLLVNETLRVLRIGKNPMQSAGCFGVLTAVAQNSRSGIEHLDFSDIVVNKDFVVLEKEVKESNPKLVIIHGGAETDKKKPKARPDPMKKLNEYMEKNDMRLVDFFNKLDADHSMAVTRQELQQGVEEAGIQLTQDEMQHLLEFLDKDGDGDINYSEMVIGTLEFHHKERLRQEQENEED